MILLDATPALERRFGIGHYVAHLMEALARLEVSGGREEAGKTPGRAARAREALSSACPASGLRALYRCVRTGGKSIPDRPPAAILRLPHRLADPLLGGGILSGESALRLAGLAPGAVDLFHATTNFLPRFRRTRTVLTVYDLAFRIDPAWMPSPASEYDRRLRVALERADHVVTISESTRQDLIRFHDTAPERVTAVLLGVETRPASAFPTPLSTSVKPPFILAVGTLEPRKNHARLIEAFERLDLPHRLVIAGARGWKDEPVLAAIDRSPRRDRIVRLDYVNSETLDALYRSADLLAYPSLHEGFGLPILEAMARGCPVVTGNGSSLPEVGGDAAFYVDPRSAAELAAAMERVLGDAALRKRMIAAGRARAAEFTWRRTAEGTMAVYRKLIG